MPEGTRKSRKQSVLIIFRSIIRTHATGYNDDIHKNNTARCLLSNQIKPKNTKALTKRPEAFAAQKASCRLCLLLYETNDKSDSN